MSEKAIRMMQSRAQAWASVREREEDIERIARNGPASEDDLNLVRRCLCLVSGEIKARRTGDIPL